MPSLHQIRKYTIVSLALLLPLLMVAQADNEIQVYASPITPKASTFVELHQNYLLAEGSGSGGFIISSWQQ